MRDKTMTMDTCLGVICTCTFCCHGVAMEMHTWIMYIFKFRARREVRLCSSIGGEKKEVEKCQLALSPCYDGLTCISFQNLFIYMHFMLQETSRKGILLWLEINSCMLSFEMSYIIWLKKKFLLFGRCFTEYLSCTYFKTLSKSNAMHGPMEELTLGWGRSLCLNEIYQMKCNMISAMTLIIQMTSIF